MDRSIGKISREQFNLLRAVFEAPQEYKKNTLSVEGVETEKLAEAIGECRANAWVDNDGLTEKGKEALEPYKVKRAIIMAAGFGSRLAPITINTPKPLVRVHGKRIIDTLLDAIKDAGIEEVVIVRGYLAEQFDQLLYKYPNIRFVDNNMYDQANNISSAVCVKDLLENAYVMEADLLISNPKRIRKYHYTSNFLGVPVSNSEDWCFVVKNKEIASQVSNGNDCVDKLLQDEELYQEIGISYWDAEAGKKLATHLKEVFDRPEGKTRYWDQVPLLDYKGEYKLEIVECDKTDIVEIDSFKELVEIDSRYSVL